MAETDSTPYVILGCGYTGTRLAQVLRAEGAPVRACGRRVALLEPLREIGVELHYMDASRPHQFSGAMRGMDRPVVVYSIPGVAGMPPGEAVRRATTVAEQINARCFIYLSTSGVYGRNELPTNDEWIDEDSSVAVNDPDMTARLGDEAAVESAGRGGLRTVVLRLSAIYGGPVLPNQPGRGIRGRLRAGQYKTYDGGRYYFSRIYIEDLVAVIRAAAALAPARSLYVVGDDHPCPQREYGDWLAAHLGLPPPPDVSSSTPGVPRQMIRGRRLRNARLKEALGLTLRYPSYREAEAHLDLLERGPTP